MIDYKRLEFNETFNTAQSCEDDSVYLVPISSVFRSSDSRGRRIQRGLIYRFRIEVSQHVISMSPAKPKLFLRSHWPNLSSLREKMSEHSHSPTPPSLSSPHRYKRHLSLH